MILFNNKRKKEKEEQERIDRVLKLEQEKEKREQEELERIERIIQKQKEKLEEEKKKIELRKEEERIKREEELQKEQERIKREEELQKEQERIKKEEELQKAEIKRLQAEKEQLQREEQERRIKKKNLVNEIIDNYISISDGITNISEELYGESLFINEGVKQLLKENLLDKIELCTRFGEIVLDMYSIADNINNYKELAEKVFEYSFIEKISKKYLNETYHESIMISYKNAVNKFNHKYDFTEAVENNENTYSIEKIEYAFEEIFSNLYNYYKTLDSMLLRLIIEKNDKIGVDYFKGEELKNRNIMIEFNGTWINFNICGYLTDEIRHVIYFITQIAYSYVFVCYIIFLRKVKPFIENEELICILNNIKKENPKIYKVLLEFYPIYSNFYEDTFEDILTEHEIETLILASDNKEKFNSLMEFNYYENIINDFKIDKDFKKLIDSIDKNIFMKYHSINDFNIVDNEEYFYNELFDYIITKIINNLNEDQILDIIFSKVIYIDRLKKNDELREILKKKNKYLYDIKEEKKINKLDISDVNTGNDFEKFLKEVFLRLGYHVALTQQTRDQGADLIIEKELVKIVVQAKFYNSTVGNKAVQEVIAAKSYYDADSCMVVTNNTFTSSAYELAEANRVKLVDGNELNSMIEIANLFLE